jgi:hypothetical protein
MPAPRPLLLVCPLVIITNFPKVQYVCSQFGGQEKNQAEPASLLARALRGSHVVTISPDGIWIGPINQMLPPLMIGGVGVSLGNPTAMDRQPFSTHPYQHQQQGDYHIPIANQGMIGMVPLSPPSFPLNHQHHLRGESQNFMAQYQQPGMSYIIGTSHMGTESSSSSSSESLPQPMNVTNFPPPNVLMGSVSTVSSISARFLKGGEPIPIIGHQGPGGVYTAPPSQPLPMLVNQTTSMLPPYHIAPLMHQLSPPSSTLGGMQQMSQPYLYYNPQQGAAPNPIQMLPYPPHHQVGYAGSHHLPPQYGYSPNFHAYHGMQQFVDFRGGGGGGGGGSGGGGGGRGFQYNGYPLPPRRFDDHRHNAGSPITHHGVNSNHDGGGKKNRADKKKQKNSQQQPTKDSFVSSTAGNKGSRNGEFNNDHHMQLHDSSTSPPIGEDKDNGAVNRPSSKNGGDEQSRFGKNRGDAMPEGFNSQDKNSHQQHRIRQQQHRQRKNDGGKVIFSPSDFPGLGGGADNQNQQRGETKPNSNLIGYASALLNKKDAPNDDSPKNDPHDNSTAFSLPTPPPPVGDEFDSHIHRTEEIEREILSEFHDLSLLGNDDENDTEEQGQVPRRDNKDWLVFASSSTMDTSEDATSQSDNYPTSESSSSKAGPLVDVNKARNSPIGESRNEDDGINTAEQQKVQPLLASNDLSSTQQHPKGLWGSKRLFSDVRIYVSVPFSIQSIFPH